MLFVGDLSYADNYPNHDNNRWDSWDRLVERSVAYQPWIWTAGNHEIDYAPEVGSYNYHYMEGESMRVMYESWFVMYKIDVVSAGYVHAYEGSERVSNIAYNIVNGICQPVKDESAPVCITIADGGNDEGLATNMTEPQPEYSAY
ncbi:hypothetical protein CTI12_AA513690 [Artemisia annua]|uniref:acid phosphatase n=1 Tax=Artemisia annua TaxID=35608 RepID=A0A2U1LB61_ARTAN|nr:hypothetical protein CTI12_AA513690 [Artemisia annua]